MDAITDHAKLFEKHFIVLQESLIKLRSVDAGRRAKVNPPHAASLGFMKERFLLPDCAR